MTWRVLHLYDGGDPIAVQLDNAVTVSRVDDHGGSLIVFVNDGQITVSEDVRTVLALPDWVAWEDPREWPDYVSIPVDDLNDEERFAPAVADIIKAYAWKPREDQTSE